MELSPHQPVLLEEVIHVFESVCMPIVVDGTVGGGGHAEALLSLHPEIEHYIAIDQDHEALSIAAKRLKPWSSKISFKHGNFAKFDDFLRELSLDSPSAILVDLGLSSMQIDQPFRGFSFMHEGPLDMRMNTDLFLTAEEIVNQWSEQELGRIFREYGEERQWKAAARAIVKARQMEPLRKTSDLKKILTPVLIRFAKKGINPLTLVFQALRIAVNRELDVLEIFLPKALDLLRPKGRLAVISFHSLEDRMVKNYFRFAASNKWNTSGLSGLFLDKEQTAKVITKKPIEASLKEIQCNPRSRSAKLRVVEKL